ncbi:MULTISPECIES: hypothetical protein [Clostridium]|uniref:Uncharacterized protein n=2 Tax=Clostridium TaxID=1485 RepID=D8GK23_CLOLD|nr:MULTISPECIES: hypothetical protein [Clostridium]ADK13141.1 hypothetical protein CLJU_c00340 [Clostridium ljungdahlii DSM 13528]AGY76364.1 hypothetical protein CAETHG_2151 [Clostridium autoethanogenum DSM 10061]ALU36527.1 Hypothetical protein CLAU_2098 [Clostridium autoethanogenum DSM 10061]OAA84379.1 hypothetical protein WX45_01042 [Clostridium ljungdahlii DSM 13528]OVY48613.1 hypothetical protein WX72_00434 [Clostridium autoethanogenum]
MEVYFSVNNREKLLRGDIKDFLVEYKHKNTKYGSIYQIYLKGLNLKNIELRNLKSDTVLPEPMKFLEDLYLKNKEFRFVIINKNLVLEESNFIATFKEFRISNNLLFAIVRKKYKENLTL